MQAYSGEYKRKLTTPADAVALIKNGDTFIHGMNSAEPPALLSAIADRAGAGDLRDIKVYSFNPQKYVTETVCRPDLCDVIESYSWFVSGKSRGLVTVGLTQYVPVYFHQVPRLIREEMTIGVTITTVSPMDQSGFFSFGTSNDHTSVAAKLSRNVIVEVNENMPRVFGSGIIHISDVDAIVENHVPLLETPPPPPKPDDALIGKHLAEIIPDGAVLQLGIGGVPNGVTPYLSGHKDLGIHSELLGPGMVDLIEKGVITGRRKNIHSGKHVYTCAYGTKYTYDFMNNNPSMESFPFDFVRGANNSKGGKSILAYYSTAKKGQISRIVPRLAEGTMVTTPRMDTDYLCTEYGLVRIKGKSTHERALAIISIAHPKFRDDLLREAENMLLI